MVRDSVMTHVVTHVTTHVALEKVPKRLIPERLRLVIELTDKAMRGLGIQRSQDLVAALLRG